MPSTETESKFDIPVERRPDHVAIIMDGNGRWAQRQEMERTWGHQKGALTVRRITEECARLEIKQLTLYCLSSENWSRPKQELDFLMQLLQAYMVQERQALIDNNICLKVIGRREGMPAGVQKEMDESVEVTASNTGTCLCLAINYGGRSEIVDAVKEIGKKIQTGLLAPEDVVEDTISKHLYTAQMSDPDLLIRTAGEMRVSNYLLWQISYAEIWVTEKMWPAFEIDDFHDAIRDYSRRNRRYGGLES